MPADLPAFLKSIPERITALRAAVELSRIRANAAADIRIALEPSLDNLLRVHREGKLAEKWRGALEKARQRGLEGEEAQTAALFVLLREQLVHVLEFVAGRNEAWQADACRAEGAGKELERVEKELLAIEGPPTAPAEVVPEPANTDEEASHGNG